ILFRSSMLRFEPQGCINLVMLLSLVMLSVCHRNVAVPPGHTTFHPSAFLVPASSIDSSFRMVKAGGSILAPYRENGLAMLQHCLPWDRVLLHIVGVIQQVALLPFLPRCSTIPTWPATSDPAHGCFHHQFFDHT
ncbi:hypothetical protein EDC04DRAFT_2766781, partial [Pisolithus marmoratus]